MSRFTGDLMDRTIFEGDYDDDREGQVHVDPDRVPTSPDGVPVTMERLVWGVPDTNESRQAWRAGR